MSDERYDRSADMRLLELRRKALGIPERVLGTTSYTDPELLADGFKDELEAYVQSGTILVASISAEPRSALIPGALVTISISIANDGNAAAESVRMSLPLPADTTYRPGTASIDGSPGSDATANELFGNGAELGEIKPGERRTLVIKIVVEAGLGEIMLAPHLSASPGAVIGLRALRLSRGAPSRQEIEVERPFYESDPAEHAREPLAPVEPQPTITVLQPRELPPIVIEALTSPAEPIPSIRAIAADKPAPKPAPKAVTKRAAPVTAKPKPRAKAKPKAKAADPGAGTQTSSLAVIVEPVARPKIEVVRSVDDRVSFTGQGGPILAVRIDGKRLATLTGLFGGPSLGMIAHYLVLNALAVRDPLPGDGTDGSIAAFVASQEQLLSRALISTRLGKTPAAGSVGAALPAFPPALATHTERRAIATPAPGEAMLFRAFQPIEISFVQRMLSNDNAAPFMRAAQLFVGLCANDAVLADERERLRVSVALTAYAALATAEISRIFLNAQVSGAPALFKTSDPSLDAAARTVLHALGRSIL